MSGDASAIVAGWNRLRPDREIDPSRARPAHVSTSLFPLYRFETPQGQVAAKVMRRADMARTEAEGLAMLHAAGARTPQVYGTTTVDDRALLFMEFVPPGRGGTTADLLDSLRKLYAERHASYGLETNNFIGSLEQTNRPTTGFADFWWSTRIEPQLQAALRRRLLNAGHLDRAREIVQGRSADWRLDRPGPRLVHGDLWSGNVLAGPDGTYLIDPSIGRSHPEQDFGMLLLFGGPLGTTELARFGESIGLDPGLEERIPFWQLYPLLVHVNIFGAGYVAGVERVLRTYA